MDGRRDYLIEVIERAGEAFAALVTGRAQAQEHAADAVLDPRYHETFVYGNVLIAGPGQAAQVVHYGGDTIGYEHVRRLLLSARTQLPLPLPPQTHEHVRGGDYFSASHREIDHAA